MTNLLTIRDIDCTDFDIINHYLRFIDKSTATKRTNAKLAPELLSFIEKNRKKIHLVTEPSVIFHEKSVTWWRKSVAPTIKMLLEIDSLRKTSLVESMIEEAELSEKKTHIIQAMTYPIETFHVNLNLFFNVYLYQEELTGVIECTDFLQLFEMERYGTPANYFDWRSTECYFAYLLNREGKPLVKSNNKALYQLCRSNITHIAYQIGIPLRAWN